MSQFQKFFKHDHVREVGAIKESIETESYERQIALQKELDILRNGLTTIQVIWNKTKIGTLS